MELALKPLSNIKDINQPWLEKMLSLKFGTTVVVQTWSYRIPNVREGFMSDIAYLNVLCSVADGQQKDLRLVLKTLPEEVERRELMICGGLDKREVDFYKFVLSGKFQDLCSEIKVDFAVPEIYYSGFLPGAVTVVMGDLSVENYKSVLIREGSTLSQTKVAFQALAKIHAAGLIYIDRYGENDENLAEIAADFNLDFADEVFIPNLESMAKMNKGTPLEDIMKALIPKTKSMLYLRKRYPLLRTFAHGDFWAGQLLFSEDESKVIVIDWQYCSIDNAATDILSMFFMSCDPRILEHHLDEILESYWESLIGTMQSAGVSLGVTYEQFKKNVQDLWLYGFMMVAISIHDFLVKDGEGNLSHERLQSYLEFLYKRGIFQDFIKMIEDEENAM